MDHLGLLIGTIFGTLASVATVFLAFRKFRWERIEIEAEAESDYATAAKTMLESYAQLSTLVTSRDVEYVDLRRKVIGLEIENIRIIGELQKAHIRIDELVTLDRQRECELKNERDLRIVAEESARKLEKTVQELRIKISQLEAEITALKSK